MSSVCWRLWDTIEKSRKNMLRVLSNLFCFVYSCFFVLSDLRLFPIHHHLQRACDSKGVNVLFICLCFLLATWPDAAWCECACKKKKKKKKERKSMGTVRVYKGVWLIMWLASPLWINVAAFSGSPEAQVSLSLSLSLLSQHHISTRGPQDHYPITVSLPEAGLILPPHLHPSFSFLTDSVRQEPINHSSHEGLN